LSTLVGGEINF